MYEDDIKAIRDWLNSEEHYFSYSHTEEEDGEDVLFVDSSDFEDFCDFLRNLDGATDLVYINGNIGKDGVWFSQRDLDMARYY